MMEKWKYNRREYKLFINFKKACNSVRKEEFYSILTEFGTPVKDLRPLKCI
jgi:hypothetical protein